MADAPDFAALRAENARFRKALEHIAELNSGGPHPDALDAALETVAILARARAIAKTALEGI